MSEEEKPREPELRKISKEEMDEILKAHAKWVEGGCDPKQPGQANLERTDLRYAHLKNANLQKAKMGNANLQRAVLDNANLPGANFWRANLQGARLEKANLRNAWFVRANLQEAWLYQANLQGAWLNANLQKASLVKANLKGARLNQADLTEANLSGAKLQGAELHHTNLSGALHLDLRELAGMDLYTTILPPEVAKFEGLKTVDEAAKKGSHLFTILLLCCLFSWLTVGFGAVAPQGGSYSVQNITVKESGFLALAPAFILGLFFYFQMYLQRLWEQLALMPAIFPDGSPLDKKAHPWLPIGYVRAHVKVLRENRPPLSKLQTVLIQATVFWAAPASVALFWLHGLQRGEAGLGIIWQAALTWLACLVAEAFIYQARHTLRREEPPPYRDAEKGMWERIEAFPGYHTWAFLRLVICAAVLVEVSIRFWPS